MAGVFIYSLSTMVVQRALTPRIVVQFHKAVPTGDKPAPGKGKQEKPLRPATMPGNRFESIGKRTAL